MATLLLRLAAPLQSWGADSKYETRKTNREPTKSGVVGLLAAALGLRRDDTAGLEPLNALRFAVRVEREGTLLADYHTACRDLPKKEDRYVTRRYYLSDAVFLVGLESEDEKLLENLSDALQNPVYPLFLGRRSCPPTLPLCLGTRPTCLLETMQREPPIAFGREQGKKPCRIVMDAAPDEPGSVPYRDLPLSFSPQYRQFGYRAVREIMLEVPPGEFQTEHDPFLELR